MEYIGGHSLDNYKDLPRGIILLLGKEISAAIAYLQVQVVIHRDIKPANIKYFNNHFKLVDFGEASNNNGGSTFCGSDMYMAPEIHAREFYTSKVDIFSFGIILAEYGYSWYNHCFFESFDIPQGDSYLPPTQSGTVPGAGTFIRNKLQDMGWGNEEVKKRSSYLNRKLEEEIQQKCQIAPVVLEMIKMDPSERCEATFCQHHFTALYHEYANLPY